MIDMLPEDQKDEIGDGYFSIFGKPLNKFSIGRQILAEILSNGSPTNNDLILVYLCVASDAEVKLMRNSAEARNRFLDDMELWAEQNGVSIYRDNPKRVQVTELANKIFADIAKTNFKVKDNEGASPNPNVLG